MSMSTHVVGFKPPNKKWEEMKFVYEACVKANIDIPEEVDKFFDYIKPDPTGVIVDLDSLLDEYSNDSESGYELKVSEIPKGVTVIRFFNSY